MTQTKRRELKEQRSHVLTGDGSLVFRSLKPCDLSKCTREDIREYFNNSYDLYESLFSAIKSDYAYYLCPDRLRLPLIFYYGHTAAVFINKLTLAGLVHPSERVNLDLETTFETGVDEMSWDDLEHYRMGGDYNWPTVSETREYRKKVRELINKVIDRVEIKLPITWESPLWAIFMGMEHERIHYETSSVLIRQYPLEFVEKPQGWVYGPFQKPNSSPNDLKIENKMIKITDTEVQLGKPFDYPSYGWDNEYGLVNCKVSSFEASKYKVTNEEFYQFVMADGYKNKEFWTEEGWEWVQFKKAEHPLFWVCSRQCKSGCGGAIASHSHCQPSHFSKRELDFFSSQEQFEHTNGHSNGHANGNGHTNGNGHVNGHSNGHANGHANGHSGQNGYSNGHANGHSNGNGHTNGHSNGNGLHENEELNNNTTGHYIPYKFRLMFEVIDMPNNWPVEVNYHEAKAFCKWKGKDYRVLTEAEHHAIRERDVGQIRSTSDELVYQDNAKTNHNMVYGSSTPVDFFPANSKGFHDVFGNVWEWVEDNFNGLPGSKTHYLYDDFSTPCYDGRHNLIMGGSWVSTGDEASDFARFMFRRHFYQHCGFRIARSLPAPIKQALPDPQVRLVEDRIFILGHGYPENSQQLDEKKLKVSFYSTTNDQYLLDSHLHPNYLRDEINFDYEKDGSPLWFDEMMKQVKFYLKELEINNESANLFGASTGRVAFELANMFPKVVAVDFCAKFLDCCIQQQNNGSFINEDCKIVRPYCVNPESIVFKQMTWIPNEVLASDFVLMTMIDRLSNYLSWIRRFREIVKKNGLLIIFSKESKYNAAKLLKTLSNDFRLIKELSVTSTNADTLTVWKKN